MVGDAGALAAAMHALLSDPVAARRMGAAGRERVDAEFNIDRTVSAYEQTYVEFLARRNPGARQVA